MTAGSFRCTGCRLEVSLGALTAGANPCPGCGRPLEVRLYPAVRRAARAETGSALQGEGESACYFHAGKRAESACSHCGRFLCALCAIDFAGETRCAACLESARRKETAVQLVERRVNHDSVVLLCGVLPVLVCYPGFLVYPVTGPLALFLTVRHWSRPLSPVRANRWRFVVGSLFGLGQLVAVVWAAVALLRAITK